MLSRPLPSSLARFFAAGTTRPPAALRGAWGREAKRGGASTALPAGLQYPPAATRGRRGAAFEPCQLQLPRAASRGRCGEETRLQRPSGAGRGQELGSHVAGEGQRESWRPRLACPEEETPRDPPAHLPETSSRLHLWPNPEHAGRRHEGQSRQGRSPTFTAMAVAAAGIAFCYSKNHVSKGEEERRTGPRLKATPPAGSCVGLVARLAFPVMASAG